MFVLTAGSPAVVSWQAWAFRYASMRHEARIHRPNYSALAAASCTLLSVYVLGCHCQISEAGLSEQIPSAVRLALDCVIGRVHEVRAWSLARYEWPVTGDGHCVYYMKFVLNRTGSPIVRPVGHCLSSGWFFGIG